MEKAQVIIMDNEHFNKIRELSGSFDEKNAFACLHKDWSYVILREEFVRSISKDELDVVVTHELAHVNGIIDEELADRWAMDNLSAKPREILKNMWVDRHGHKY